MLFEAIMLSGAFLHLSWFTNIGCPSCDWVLLFIAFLPHIHSLRSPFSFLSYPEPLTGALPLWPQRILRKGLSKNSWKPRDSEARHQNEAHSEPPRKQLTRSSSESEIPFTTAFTTYCWRHTCVICRCSPRRLLKEPGVVWGSLLE